MIFLSKQTYRTEPDFCRFMLNGAIHVCSMHYTKNEQKNIEPSSPIEPIEPIEPGKK